jgi:hypothetical protein
MVIILGRYSTREQAVVLKALARERGEGWARLMSRDDYRVTVYDALVKRYGDRS